MRYVAVGGVAVVLHGHARLTTDLDLSVDLSPEPAAAAVRALEALGFRPRLPLDPAGFSDEPTRTRWAEEKGMTVFSMWDPDDPTRAVDLFVTQPVDFEGLWSRSTLVQLEGTQARIASIPDLIKMKQESRRPLDLADVEALTTILDDRERQG